MRQQSFVHTDRFIAQRLFRDKSNHRQLSKKILNIALLGIALGISVMLLAIAVVTGFKRTITDKVFGFGAHIQLVNFDSNYSFETSPVNAHQPFLPHLDQLPNVAKVSRFATKPGIIKTDEYIQGIILKGVDEAYNWEFFANHLVEGEIPNLSSPERSNELLVSENLCKLLRIKLNDQILVYFILPDEQIPRIRQFRVSGIYNTNLQEFDNIFVYGDLRQVQHINNWEEDQISGFEILIKNYTQIGQTFEQVRNEVVYYSNDPGNTLRPVSVEHKYPQIFDWLSILDMNVWVILILMIAVAGFNMISALLVLILERSRMIGILKSLGSSNHLLRNLFLYLSFYLLTRGLFWGNLLGLSIIFLQKYFEIFQLDPASYYMSVVPVFINPISILLLNLGVITTTLLMLLLPTFLIGKISPAQSIAFD